MVIAEAFLKLASLGHRCFLWKLRIVQSNYFKEQPGIAACVLSPLLSFVLLFEIGTKINWFDAITFDVCNNN